MNDYQSLGSGITYLRRYSLSTMLGLITDKDVDACGEAEPKKKPLTHIAIPIDESGSVGNDEFTQFFSEIDKIVECGTKVTIIHADCTVNKNPTTEQLVEITLQITEAVEQFKIQPRVAFVSYSNFGSNPGRIPSIQRDAVAILHEQYPELIVDGEMQANVALNNNILEENFPFSKLVGVPANTLIFPYLTAGNVAYKLLQELADVEIFGPIIKGLNKSVHVLPIGSSVNEIVNMVMLAAIDAQAIKENNKVK